MLKELLPYYERELVFIRKMAWEFAQQHPERAAALKLSRNGCDDPHVERMIEAFALIAGRIQRKIDDEYPEITQALLDLLYPHFLRPVPSLAIAHFAVDPDQSTNASGHEVARGAITLAAPVGGVRCKFRTAYAARLWPLSVVSGAFTRAANVGGAVSGSDARYAIRLELQTQGAAKWSGLRLSDLRFYLGGDAQAAYWLYELVFNKVSRVLLRYTDRTGRKRTVTLGPEAIRPVGFGREEALLPYADTSFQGYRLLQEYFHFPAKFLFFDLAGWPAIEIDKPGEKVEILFLVEDFQREERATFLETTVDAETFQLGCVPVVNLFDQCSEPIRVTHAKTEYKIIPDLHAPLGLEVYAVERVTSVSQYLDEPKEYRPFYSFRHGEEDTAGEAFWLATRRASEQNNDSGTDTYLSLVNGSFQPSMPASESITAYLTCTNRDLPGRLGLKAKWGELEVEGSEIVRARAVHGPTKPVRTPLGRGLEWRLISHLSLNHLSLIEGGVSALRELLGLYRTDASGSVSRQIAGLVGIRSSRKMARVESDQGLVFCQGTAVDAELDEEMFAGAGPYLLACILERFLGLYCGINSFTQLRVSTRQRKGVVWQWAPRTGEQIVA
jgi:type VI secretion system protein ImpG